MEMKDLLAKDVNGLNNELSELLKAQFKLRMQKGTQQLQDTSQLGKTKKAIARVKTAMNHKAAEK
jgi:large subunit ribosomal protein L29